MLVMKGKNSISKFATKKSDSEHFRMDVYK